MDSLVWVGKERKTDFLEEAGGCLSETEFRKHGPPAP
jgi:hypothetical protein